MTSFARPLALGPRRAGAARPPAAAIDERDAAEPSLPRGFTWLVDGYNALHACLLSGSGRQRWWTAESRELLLARGRCFGDVEAEIWVVFDGGRESQQTDEPPPAHEPDAEGGARNPSPAARRLHAPAAVHVVFTPSADDWITRRVRRAERPGQIAVVTGDRQVAGRCAHRGARVVGPRAFLASCRQAAPPPPDSPAP